MRNRTRLAGAVFLLMISPSAINTLKIRFILKPQTTHQLQHPLIEDRREPGSYIAPRPDPWDEQFVEEKKRLLSHGFVRWYGGTPLSRALGEDDLMRAEAELRRKP